MDLFEKCDHFETLKYVRKLGIYPYFHALESRQDTEVVMEGKRRIMLGSNNYLGLTTHPDVIKAGLAALEQYGSGCSGSRFLNGTLKLHLELEAADVAVAVELHGEHGCATGGNGRIINIQLAAEVFCIYTKGHDS
jgi:7-keto-8-aminopelargonate synthetase-like enzyme